MLRLGRERTRFLGSPVVLLAVWGVLFLIAPRPARAETLANAGAQVSQYYGSFSTDVPIAVPQYHGLEPQLKLVYTSTPMPGLAGVGWSLSGLSFIERALPGGGAPKYDANDAFFLDGMELVRCTSQGGTHCTKIQNYTRIQQNGDEWYVYGTNGNKATYSTKFITSKGTFRWLLTSVTDPHGNSVTYNYLPVGNPVGYLYPNTITYNGTTIKLYYENRTDPITFATGAGMGVVSRRLKSIDVQVSGSRVRAYQLVYYGSGGTGQSRLQTVRQFGNDALVNVSTGQVSGGTSLPAVGFAYNADAGSFAQTDFGKGEGVGYWPDHQSRSYEPFHFTGDFDGDGKTDFMYWVGSRGDSSWRVLLSTGNSFTEVDFGLGYADVNYQYVYGRQPFHFTGDFNGDGKTDFMYFSDHWRVLQSTGSSFERVSFGPTRNHCCSKYDPYPRFEIIDRPQRFSFTGDFNGDGRTDLMYWDDTWHVLLSTATPVGDFVSFRQASVTAAAGRVRIGHFPTQARGGDRWRAICPPRGRHW
ncbi:MAG: SpvB/TcaC N-terminal domain-containing protein, partial [Thermodesulfobacteriota bacterium]